MYTDQEKTLKNFKKAAKKEMKNDKFMKNFAKDDFSLVKSSALNETLGESEFGVSFNAFYLRILTKEEALKAYQFKDLYCKQRTLSSQIFNKSTIIYLVSLFEQLFSFY